MSDVNPVDYLAAILDGHPQSRIEDLMPWRYAQTQRSGRQLVRKGVVLDGCCWADHDHETFAIEWIRPLANRAMTEPGNYRKIGIAVSRTTLRFATGIAIDKQPIVCRHFPDWRVDEA